MSISRVVRLRKCPLAESSLYIKICKEKQNQKLVIIFYNICDIMLDLFFFHVQKIPLTFKWTFLSEFSAFHVL